MGWDEMEMGMGMEMEMEMRWRAGVGWRWGWGSGGMDWDWGGMDGLGWGVMGTQRHWNYPRSSSSIQSTALPSSPTSRLLRQFHKAMAGKKPLRLNIRSGRELGARATATLADRRVYSAA